MLQVLIIQSSRKVEDCLTKLANFHFVQQKLFLKSVWQMSCEFWKIKCYSDNKNAFSLADTYSVLQKISVCLTAVLHQYKRFCEDWSFNILFILTIINMYVWCFLTLKASSTTAASEKLFLNTFTLFSEKIRFDISCESSASQRIHMKYHILFSSKD